MRLLSVINLPVILLALVAGAAAAPSNINGEGNPDPQSGSLSLFFLSFFISLILHFFLVQLDDRWFRG